MTFYQRAQLLLTYYIVLWLGLTGIFVINFFEPQANQLLSVLDQNVPIFTSEAISSLEFYPSLLSIFAASLIPSFFLLVFKNRTALILMVFALVGMMVAMANLITKYQLMPPIFYILLSYGLGILIAILLKMIFSSTEKDFLRAAFSQFVSEDMLKELLRDPGKLRLTGKEYNITVMFLDIRGFTSYSEKKTPAIVVARLNELLEIVTSIIIKNDGTVDKYIGDAVMAMWGAPAADKKQATKAVKAALEIKQKIESETDFSVGIGINYGKAIVGNIGSTKRFDYTAIGDTVNTASRIEGLTKSLGQSIVVSKSVVEKVETETGKYSFEGLGQVLVKGKNTKLRVYGVK